MEKLRKFWTQSFRIPKPVIDEESLGDQHGKVVIVTGGYAGIGYEVCNILYKKNATVYVAGRSPEKAKERIDSIVAANPNSEGKVTFLKLDLSDLSTIKVSVDEFSAKESQLHVLINNAGIMDPPPEMMSPQNIDIQFATNILGPFLFTKLLLATLHSTANISDEGLVRVSWAGSLGLDLMTPKGGMDFTEEGSLKSSSPAANYGVTKAANYFLGYLFASHYKNDGVLYNSFNPGNLKSELNRHAADKHPAFFLKLIGWILLYPPRFGAYTELYAAFSHDLTIEKDQGAYIVPWGRKALPRKDLVAEAEKREGKAEKLWAWCEKETGKYM